MTTMPSLRVVGLADPPATSVVEVDTEVSLMLSLCYAEPPTGPGFPLHLAVIPVGDAGLGAHDPSQYLVALRPGDQLSLPGRGTFTVGVEQGRTAIEDACRAAFAAPTESLTEALHLGRTLLEADTRDGVARRIILAVFATGPEQVDGLLAAATAVNECQLGADVFCRSSQTDAGLLIRLANLGGGEIAMCSDSAAVCAAMATRFAALGQQHLLDVRMELDVSPGLVPGRLYRVAPTPVYLGTVRVTGTDRKLLIDPGPVALGLEPSFLLTLNLGRRRVGRYRLLDARIRHRSTGARAFSTQTTVVFPCTDSPLDLQVCEAAVVAARDRVEPAGWIEDATRFFGQGDHRGVATTLERISRRFLELGRPADAAFSLEARTRYLRTAHLDRSDVNRLRRMALGR